MITLNWWETVIFETAIGFLQILATKVTNPVTKAAIADAITFLQQLIGGSMAGVAKALPKPVTP